MSIFNRLRSALSGNKRTYSKPNPEAQQYHKKLNRQAYIKTRKQYAETTLNASARVGSVLDSIARQRQKQIAYGRALKRPIVRSLKMRGQAGRVKFGRGRPSGPSGRYVIPGVGAVGVYEYRKWFNSQLRVQRMQAQQQAMQNMGQMREFQRRQMIAQTPQEQRTIPNTSGFVPMGGIHKEIDDAANMVP